MSLIPILPGKTRKPLSSLRQKVVRYVGRHAAMYGAPATLTDVARDLNLKHAEAYDLLSDLEAEGLIAFTQGRATGGGWHLVESATAA